MDTQAAQRIRRPGIDESVDTTEMEEEYDEQEELFALGGAEPLLRLRPQVGQYAASLAALKARPPDGQAD